MIGRILKPHASVFAAAMRLADPLVALAVGVFAYRIYLGSFALPEHYLLLLAGGTILVLGVFPLFRLYEPQRGASLSEELRRLVLSWALVAATVGGVIFATKTGAAYSRAWVILWLAGGFVATALLRVSTRLLLRRLRRGGFNLRHIVIVGAGNLGREVARRLDAAAWSGFNVVGFYDDRPELTGSQVGTHPVRGSIDRLADDIAAGGIDQVWIALPLRAEVRIRHIVSMLEDQAVVVRFVPDIYGFRLLHHSMAEVAGLPVIALTETPLTGVNRVVKTAEDYVLGALALVVALPLMALIAVGVKLSSPGPIVYRQERVTWNGRRFTMLKFRTMPQDIEADSGPVWSKPQDHRATPFGAFLRRFSLDELPQLFNVLSGDMSLVGPRPERPEFVAQFRNEVPRYMQKHLVKAGITGWAQVNDLRGDTDLSQRIQYDLFYIEHWSFWFDLRILALTIAHLLTTRNAH